MDVAELMKKKIWKLEQTTDQWKKGNIQIVRERLTGWQLKSFEDPMHIKLKMVFLYSKKFKK